MLESQSSEQSSSSIHSHLATASAAFCRLLWPPSNIIILMLNFQTKQFLLHWCTGRTPCVCHTANEITLHALFPGILEYWKLKSSSPMTWRFLSQHSSIPAFHWPVTCQKACVCDTLWLTSSLFPSKCQEIKRRKKPKRHQFVHILFGVTRTKSFFTTLVSPPSTSALTQFFPLQWQMGRLTGHLSTDADKPSQQFPQEPHWEKLLSTWQRVTLFWLSITSIISAASRFTSSFTSV